MHLDLKDQHVLVTGGASGLGAAISRALVAEGARVTINYRSRREEAVRLQAELGESTQIVQADLNKPRQVEALYSGAIQGLGPVDRLVNNAGLWLTTQLGETTPDEWHASIDVNLTSAFDLSQRFIRDALARNAEEVTGAMVSHDALGPRKTRGRILSITSQAAFAGSTTGHLPYAVAKAGLVAMTRALVRETGASGITANCLAVGIMDTPLIADTLRERREYYENRIPLGRVATPEEIADIALFLLSDRSGYITGATIDATGGMLLH